MYFDKTETCMYIKESHGSISFIYLKKMYLLSMDMCGVEGKRRIL